MRKQTRAALGVLMIVVGGLWCAQGLGRLSGSDMSGHRVWAVIGAAVLVGGAVVLVRAIVGEDETPAWAVDPAVDSQPEPGTWSERMPDPPAEPPGGPEQTRPDQTRSEQTRPDQTRPDQSSQEQR